tara:strand:- start:961 stop:1206 length:246 start_codon:yes stop_codon:yes gene_type:complete
MTGVVAEGLRRAGHDVGDVPFFDTLRVTLGDGTSAADVHAASKVSFFRYFYCWKKNFSLDYSINLPRGVMLLIVRMNTPLI